VVRSLHPDCRPVLWRRLRAAFEEWPVRRSIEHLAGPLAISPDGGLPVVVALMRNAEIYIEAFLAHYRALGCRHIVLLDNGSTDQSVDLATKAADVTLLRSLLPYKDFKRPLRRYLVQNFGRHRWCLSVDIDEFFDYPFSDSVPLREFLRYLETQRFTAVAAQMLDLFPEHLQQGHDAAGGTFREQHRYYDVANIERRDYFVHNNRLADPRLKMIFGGIRKTLFDFAPWLTKHPLFWSDGKILPFYNDFHCVERACVADVSAVLYHYKFAGDFTARVAEAVQAGNYYRNSLEYQRYNAVLEQSKTLQMRQPTSEELRSPNQLLASGFLFASENYARFAAQQR